MPQNADHVLDHFDLFRQPEYREMLANKKKNFENPVAEARVPSASVEWTEDPGISGEEFCPRGADR